jgi:NADH-quinone oxidoreductase subunit C
MMEPRDLAERLRAHFPHEVAEVTEFRGEVTARLASPEDLPTLCAFARDKLACDLLLDITSIDHYGETPRWRVVYQLYSLKHRAHLRLAVTVEEAVSELPTVTPLWRTADWHEREIYDLMGLRFRGHPDLRRILMWEGYPYFPLRKDFPLAGKPSAVAEVAFSDRAPLEGGPFVSPPGATDAVRREPRARPSEDAS